MKFIADLHIHSPYSRATSKASNLAGLSAWARVKGINVVGTGDFTHPGWLGQLKEQLVPAEPGLFRLKNEAVPPALDGITPADIPVRFILSAEISSIYKRHGKVRKIHNILYAPDFKSVENLNATLAGIGNIESDGRPILGLDARDLLEILLEQAPDGFLVPAHIWTPWFSLFGSKSGFDAIEECFGDLAEHIFALETGLSSDPDMNRLVSQLDRFTLISNSDCHSPAKLGREANIFDTALDYFAMRDALRSPGSAGFGGTIEFFPEEGKYHCDGHRKCQVCMEPAETRSHKAICPVCGRPLTVGVLHRVMELADRDQPYYPDNAPKSYSIIPLPEVLGEIIGAGPNTKGVMSQYGRVIEKFGSEFDLLLHVPVADINRFWPVLGEAVSRIRSGAVIRQPGYDGEFGVIRVFDDGELAKYAGQIALFTGRKRTTAKKKSLPGLLAQAEKPKEVAGPAANRNELNQAQQEAVASRARRILVTAGPGTGKTFTLVTRLARLITEQQAAPRQIAAITFTNRAAGEVRERLVKEAGQQAEKVFVGTFHGFCLDWLRKSQPELTVVGEETRHLLFRNLFPEYAPARLQELQRELADYCNALATAPPAAGADAGAELNRYLAELERRCALDLDMVIPRFVGELACDKALKESVSAAVSQLFVDEFQDLNLCQYELVETLAGAATVFAIGDPDQAIYGFRGSDLNFFFRFAAHPETHGIALTDNYRSAPAILEAAAGVIGNNRQRSRARLVARRNGVATIEYHRAQTPQAEAENIVRRIEETMGGISHFSINSGRGGNPADTETGFGDIAILYRLARQADALREALERRGIPFQAIGAVPFYMEKTVRPLYYLLKIAAGRAEAAEHLALISTLPGIGALSVRKLEQELPLDGKDFFATVARHAGLPDRVTAAIAGLGAQARQLQHTAPSAGIATALRHVLRFFDIDQEHDAARRFLELAGAFGTNLTAFARHLEENSAATAYDPRAEAVALMSMHAAKGLEFPVVFLPGLEEDIIPCTLGGRACDVEEERRLFYVALTRAKQRLCLSSAATRTVFGRAGQQRRSRFIDEIPAGLLTAMEQPKKNRRQPQATQMRLF